MNNYMIDAFYKKLVKDINECGLPVGVAFFVMKDCLNQIETGYKLAINEENPANNQSEEQVVTIDKEHLDNIDATEGEIEIAQ